MNNPTFTPPDLPLDSSNGPIIKVSPPHAFPGDPVVFEIEVPELRDRDAFERAHVREALRRARSCEIPMTEIYY